MSLKRSNTWLTPAIIAALMFGCSDTPAEKPVPTDEDEDRAGADSSDETSDESSEGDESVDAPVVAKPDGGKPPATPKPTFDAGKNSKPDASREHSQRRTARSTTRSRRCQRS